MRPPDATEFPTETPSSRAPLAAEQAARAVRETLPPLLRAFVSRNEGFVSGPVIRPEIEIPPTTRATPRRGIGQSIPRTEADFGDYRRLRPTALRDTLRRKGGPGMRLESSLRERLRKPLQFDPTQARLHRGPVAADAARALGALAFTIGHDVFFAEGQYQPTVPTGLELLAHELTHVGQRARLGGDRMRFFTATGGDAMEEEAQQTAARVRELTPPRPPAATRHSDYGRPVMQLARMAGGSTTFGDDEALSSSPASSVGTGGGSNPPSTRTVTDHVYDLMKRELMVGRRRGQIYRKG